MSRVCVIAHKYKHRYIEIRHVCGDDESNLRLEVHAIINIRNHDRYLF